MMGKKRRLAIVKDRVEKEKEKNEDGGGGKTLLKKKDKISEKYIC